MTESLTTEERVALLTRNYSTEAPVYERTWAPSLARVGRQLLDHLPVDGASAILDLGAGTGALVTEIAGRTPRALVVGVDRSEGMIARAPANLGRVVMDGTRLGFSDDSFDMATMCFVLFHFPDPLDGLKEARRVLTPGGTVGILTWGQEEEWPAFELWYEILDELGAAAADPPLSQHDLVNAPGKLEGLLADAGFSGVKTWTETLRTEWDLDSLLDFATGVAVSRRRLESLDPQTRERCVALARDRLAKLRGESFVQVCEVVAASALKT